MDELKHAKDLQTPCPLCKETGQREQCSFAEHKPIMRTCHQCKGTGLLWALDQQQMTDRIDGLMGQVIRWQEWRRKLMAILGMNGAEPFTDLVAAQRLMEDNAALRAQVEQLKAQVKMYAQPACLQQFPRSWSATGAKQKERA